MINQPTSLYCLIIVYPALHVQVWAHVYTSEVGGVEQEAWPCFGSKMDPGGKCSQ